MRFVGIIFFLRLTLYQSFSSPQNLVCSLGITSGFVLHSLTLHCFQPKCDEEQLCMPTAFSLNVADDQSSHTFSHLIVLWIQMKIPI